MSTLLRKIPHSPPTVQVLLPPSSTNRQLQIRLTRIPRRIIRLRLTLPHQILPIRLARIQLDPKPPEIKTIVRAEIVVDLRVRLVRIRKCQDGRVGVDAVSSPGDFDGGPGFVVELGFFQVGIGLEGEGRGGVT